MEKEILKNLYFDSALSIAELVKKLAKSTPSITKIINRLLEEKIIVECGFAESTGGRRPLQFAINPALNFYILTISTDQHFSTFTLTDLNQQTIIEHRDVPLELKSSNSADLLLDEIESILELSGIQRDKIIGIGLSIPGFVNSELGVNESYPHNHPLYRIKSSIEAKYQISTVIENDSRCIAIAEKEFGSAKDIDHSLIINLNWGVGLGIIINGSVFKGESGFAGEFSHIPLSDDNTLCSCGKRGCLEVEASLDAAIRSTETDIQNNEYSIYSTFVKSKLNKIDALIEASNVGDQIAINNLGKIGYMLGKGISTLIHILNPKQIIVSGRGAELGRILNPQIQIAINEFCIPEIAKTTNVQMSSLNKHAQIKGTAAIVVENHINKILTK
ncbi:MULTISPECIES: ROK family protein [Sphingobacterium]|jgi:N-acetylglucosamine repressor|uniref:ROK family protein n=1 Tax=Sphingobacterium TaxID=28453 RepID=UPI000EF0BCE0|nr:MULTISPECIES: ROK family protein [Sphingobacterium]HAL52536.1 ROK family protein [Sphingobacterium sp.]HCX56163.1 ROK family protein [Sphingobacterium sp.]